VRRLALLAAAFALAALAAGMVVQAPTAQTASPEACRSEQAVIPAADLPETVDLEDCPIGGSVIRDNGVGTVLPDPGEGIYVEALTTEGSQELGVTRYRDGTVKLEHVGEESAEAQDEPEVGVAASSRGECSDRAYTRLPYKVTSTLDWFFNPKTTPDELSRRGAEKAIRAGGANITNTKNNCRLGDRVPRRAGLSYEGRTSARAQLNASAQCSGPDGQTVVSFGRMQNGSLAAHCTAWVQDPDGPERVISSDILINKKHYSWTTNPGARSCRSKYDLASVVTHERGHTYGLGHVSEGSHGKLTMSERINGTCQASERSLGRGDVLGLGRKY
jgi:hypothetical protein